MININFTSEKDTMDINGKSCSNATGFASFPGEIVTNAAYNATGSEEQGKAPLRNSSNNGHHRTKPGCGYDKAQSEGWKTKSVKQELRQIKMASPADRKKFSEVLAKPLHVAKSAVPPETHSPGAPTENWNCPTVKPLTKLPKDLMVRITNALDLAWEKLLRDDGSLSEAKGITTRGKGRKKAPGIDRKSTLTAYKEYQANPDKMVHELLTDYMPSAIRRTFIPKPSGDLRPLGIPTARDRAMQTAVLMIIGPMLEPQFAYQSHGFIHYRSVYTATEQALRHIKSGMRFAVSIDISKFFDSVDHRILMRFFAEICPDVKLCRLVERILEAEIVLEDGSKEKPGKGTPQGGIVSPLLANIYLHWLDVELARRGLSFVRYADDLVIFANSLKAAKRILKSVSDYVKRELNLDVNLEKSKPVVSYGMDFLGFTLKDKITVSEKALEKFRQNVCWMTMGKSPRQTERNFEVLTQWLSGWFAHYGRIIDRDLMAAMNEWVSELLRQRVRAGYPFAQRTITLWNQGVQARKLGIKCKLNETIKDEVF